MPRRRTVPVPTDLSPLSYLLSIVRDPGAAPSRRARLPIATLPYCHARLAEKTKKAQTTEAAGQAGTGTAWGGDLLSDEGTSEPCPAGLQARTLSTGWRRRRSRCGLP